MADFHLWATINQTAPNEFAVIVSAVMTDEGAEGTLVRVAVARNRELALQESEALLVRVGQIIESAATVLSM